MIRSQKKYFKKINSEDVRYKFKEFNANSNIVFVCNIKYNITEERFDALFSMVGEIKSMIFYVNPEELLERGFGFVEFYKREDAEEAVRLFGGFGMNNKPLKCEIGVCKTKKRKFGRDVKVNKSKKEV